MSDCQHGLQHQHHHHQHIGVAEGIAPGYVKKLQWVMALAVLYLLGQAFGSVLSGSLALMADAGHKLADITALSLALVAAWLSHLSSSPRKTFGFYRLEILAALLNGLGLMLIAVFILWEAANRAMSHDGVEIEGGIMLVVALIGLAINLISARILYPSRELNLNVKGALFHLLADVLNSFGEIMAAVSILLFKAYWLDTLISVIIAALVFYNAFRVFKEALNIFMEAAPHHLNVRDIKHFIMEKPGVMDVHDLHVWTITTGKNALLAHVRVQSDAFTHETVRNLEVLLRDAFNFCHITIQLEPPGFEEAAIPCRTE